MIQKITPFLWFDKNCQEAMNFYISIFDNSRIVSIKRYPEKALHPAWEGFQGKIITAVFELMGQRFMALDGGPHFKFNPSVSFTITCANADVAQNFYDKLSADGEILMPFQQYPWAEKYGWLQDRFGVSWQINTEKNGGKIIPSLMFIGKHFGKCDEAINFYMGIFKNSSIETIARYEKDEGDVEGKIKYSHFLLEGQPFRAMENSFPHKFEVSGAISFHVECEDQNEVDYYWNKLTEEADSKAQQCGWLADKFDFSWQIIPKILGEYLSDPDPVKSERVMKAMLQMKKIDIEGLKRAYNE
ncbi:MAG TPA: VOC family protein [Candidatus Paceibacterota bacterium]